MDERSPAQFIVQLGGPHKVARVLNTDPRKVVMWKVRNRIPRNAWPEIIDAFPGVTLDELRTVESRGA